MPKTRNPALEAPRPLNDFCVRFRNDLAGTEDWYQASYLWSVVTMAIPIRSQLSANKCKRTLFVVQARDEYVSYLDAKNSSFDFTIDEQRREIARAVLAYPCMNETGSSLLF